MSATSHEKGFTTGRFYIPGLDAIRGMAVLLTFVFHSEVLPHIPGELGTTAFFFLSGFLITTLFLREWKKTGTVQLGAFYFRRVLRILPPLYIVLALAYAAHRYLGLGAPLESGHVLGNLFQFTNYSLVFGDRDGCLPGMILLWSLAVDEHYYIFYAPLFKGLINRISVQKMTIGVGLLCLATLLWRIYLFRADGVTLRMTMATDCRVDSILWGSFLALWRNPALDPGRAKVLAKPLLVMAGALCVVIPELSGSWNFRATYGYTLEGIGFMSLFSLAMLQGGKGWLKFLEWRPLVWYGRVSYPLYLTQWLILGLCYQFVPGSKWVQFGVAFAAATAVSAAMHLGIERPLMALRRNSKKRVASAPAAPSLQPITAEA